MKVKTADLIGPALGGPQVMVSNEEDSSFDYRPSTIWSQGGPLIEREHISVDNRKGDPCRAFKGTPAHYEFRRRRSTKKTMINTRIMITIINPSAAGEEFLAKLPSIDADVDATIGSTPVEDTGLTPAQVEAAQYDPQTGRLTLND